jgi:hypothetical protein
MAIILLLSLTPSMINYVFYPVYNSQQDAHVTEFILYNSCSTCSGVTITHLQEHKTNVTTAFGTVTPYCCLLLSWKSWNCFECVVGGVPPLFHKFITHFSFHFEVGNITL